MIPPWFAHNSTILLHDITAGSFDLWLLARWTMQSIFLSLLVFLADLLLGSAILRVCRVRLPARLRGAAAIATGAGASAVLILVLGILRRILFPWVLGLTIASALAGIWLLLSKRGRWYVFGFAATLRSRWWLLVAPVAVFHTLSLLMPVMEFDATMYHQASARWYEETHRLAFNDSIRFNAQPHLPVLLFLRHRILFGEDMLVKLVNVEFALVLYLALAHFARRLRISSAWPVLFLLCSPAFVWIAQLDYVDFAMTVWFAAAVVLLIERRPAIGIAAFVLGCAAASKLQGTVMAGILGASYLLYRRDWRRVAALAAGVALLSLPWWLRSFRHTGSPIAPFFLPGNPESQYLFELSRKYGDGRDAIALLKLPWNAVAASPLVFADVFAMGPVLALGVAAGTLAIYRRKRPSAQTVFLSAVFFAYFLFWFRTGQVMRYLAAALPLLAMLVASAVAATRLPRWLLAPLAVAAFAISLLPSAMIRYRTLPPVRYKDKEGFLYSHLPYYSAARELRRVAHPAERTYLWFAEEARYYVPTRSTGDWFGPMRYGAIGASQEPASSMVGRIQEAGFNYLLIDRRLATHFGTYGEPWLSSGLVRQGGPLPAGLQPLYSDDRYALFRLH